MDTDKCCNNTTLPKDLDPLQIFYVSIKPALVSEKCECIFFDLSPYTFSIKQ
jgi:hypothetical protein